MKRSTARKAHLSHEYQKQQKGFLPGASVKEILERETARPMRAYTMQTPPVEGLFGEGHKQAELFA